MDVITGFLCTLFGLTLGLIILLLCADIVLRNVGITSLPWVIELTEYALYGGTFLAAPYVLRIGGHVRVEILFEVLSRESARLLDRITDVCGLGVSLVMTYYGTAVVLDSYRSGMIQFKSMILPEWPLLLPIPVGCALLCIEFVMRLSGVRAAPETEPAPKQFSI